MSDQTLEERLRQRSIELRMAAIPMEKGTNRREVVQFVAAALEDDADEVGALEREHHIMTGMTIEAAGSGIVESQEAAIAKLEAVLREIRDSPHCAYPLNDPFVSEGQSQYKIGIADGHRCAAGIARKALEDSK